MTILFFFTLFCIIMLLLNIFFTNNPTCLLVPLLTVIFIGFDVFLELPFYGQLYYSTKLSDAVANASSIIPTTPWTGYNKMHTFINYPTLLSDQIYFGKIAYVDMPRPTTLSLGETKSIYGMKNHFFYGEPDQLWIATKKIPDGFRGQTVLFPCPVCLLSESEIKEMLFCMEKKNGLNPLDIFEDTLRMKFSNSDALSTQYLLQYDKVHQHSFIVHTKPLSCLHQIYFQLWYHSINHQLSLFYETMEGVDRSTYDGWVSQLTLAELVLIWKQMMFYPDQIKELSSEFIVSRNNSISRISIIDYVSNVLHLYLKNERKID